MANTKAEYIGDGVTDTFAITFPRLSPTHVEVYVNNTQLATPSFWSVQGGNVVFVAPPGDQALIRIQRNTDINNRLVDYNDGAVLTEEELDLDSKQAFYLAQEVQENYSALIDDAKIALATALGIVVVDPDAVVDQLVQNILADPLAADLQARIIDIDLNAQNILALTGIVDGWGVTILANESDVTALDVRLTTAESDVLAAAGVASANSGAITALDVRVTSNEGNISTSATDISNLTAALALTDGNVSGNAGAVSALDVRVTTAEGNITSSASDITTLQSRVTTTEGDIASAEITILANTNANIATQGALDTAEADIVTLEARYGVTLNVNGYITGFEQFNAGDSGTFQIMADNFYIVDPAGGGQNPTIPFAVTGGVVYMDNITVRSDPGTGKRIVLNSATNEAEFYGDRGDLSVVKLATIGINSALGDSVIGLFGSAVAGTSRTAILAQSNTGKGIYAYSIANDAIYAATASNSHSAVNGVSAANANSSGLRGQAQTNARGVWGEALADSGGFGVYGQVRASAGSTKTGYAGYFEHQEDGGIPLLIKPDSADVDPLTTSINEGSIWMDAGGNRMYVYRNDDWADLGKPKPVNFSTGNFSSFVGGGLKIPPECSKVTIFIYAMSSNGSSDPVLQMAYGATPTWTVTGYTGYVDETSAAGAASSIGLPLAATWASGRYWTGKIELMRRAPSGNVWHMVAHGVSNNGANAFLASSYVFLSGELSDLRLIATNGTDAFTAGQVTVYAERF